MTQEQCRKAAEDPESFKLAGDVLSAIANAEKEPGITAARRAYLTRARHAWQSVAGYAWEGAENFSEEMRVELAKVEANGVPNFLKRGSVFEGKASKAAPLAARENEPYEATCVRGIAKVMAQPTSPRFAQMSRAELYQTFRDASRKPKFERGDGLMAVATMAKMTGQSFLDVYEMWLVCDGQVTPTATKAAPAKTPEPAAVQTADDGKYRLASVPGSKGLYRGTWGAYQQHKKMQAAVSPTGKSSTPADEHSAKAAREWAENANGCRETFVTEGIYIAYRRAVLSGRYREMGKQTRSVTTVTHADYVRWKQNNFN
jgi:hypothetical protein